MSVYFVCLRKQLYLAIVLEPIYIIQNDEKKFRSRLYQTNHLTGGRVQIRHCTPIRRKGGAHAPVHPSLDTGLGKTYILILFLSDLHMHIVMFQPYFFIKIVILFLICMHITFPSNFICSYLANLALCSYLWLGSKFMYSMNDVFAQWAWFMFAFLILT